MKRDIAKCIADYRKSYYGKRSQAGAFYSSDVLQLLDMVNFYSKDAVCDLAFNALEAGFMVGYRKAKYDMKKKKEV